MKSLEERQRAHVFYTWTAQNRATPVEIRGGKGAFFEDHQGNRWLDFESQVFNCNLGHGETRIVDAIRVQAAELACAHPAAVYEAKVQLGEALARIAPGDVDKFFLCLSGSEAAENALKIARLLTGRSKVIARRRSYHGASMGAASLTGDQRRWHVEPGLWGIARVEDPYCYRCPLGLEPNRCGTACANHLEHVIQMEGPERIAAVFMEGVTGTNGGFIPPDDYWPKVRQICDRYGILLVADEVFSGFGRTGRWFAVNHWDVTPDLILMAKGITGGYAPLGVVGVRRELADRFDNAVLWSGLTSYAHPISCAAAVAAIGVYEADEIIENSARMGEVLQRGLARLMAKHDVIGDVRNLGLFGTIEFVSNRESRTPRAPYPSGPDPSGFLERLYEALRARRVHIAHKWSHLFIAPPLCINEGDLEYGLGQIDEAIVDALKGDGK